MEYAATEDDVLRLISNAANVITENNSFSHEFGIERVSRYYVERSELSLDVTGMLGDLMFNQESMQSILIPIKLRCEVVNPESSAPSGIIFIATLESLVMVAAFGHYKYIARYSWGE